MFRAILPFACLLAACNPPLAAEKQAIFPNLNEVVPGEYIAIMSVTMGVGEGTRALRSELEMNVGGLIEEGTTVDGELTTPFLEPIPTFEPSAHTGNVAMAFEPAFETCDGSLYTEREDGGCEVTVLGIVSVRGNGALAPRVGFIARSFETETWTGSKDDVKIDLTVDEIEAE